ncbi:AAA family ATPase [Acetobacterium sp.]|uniref:AAA family ATPase n=1 Tax=Acetobacterium sp. TaxID=1872094 RepID=UPI002F3F8263
MLIRKMEMKNFFRIYDKVEIEFAQDSDKNVTVIKGDNGMGKTTVLSAFYWAFYGDVLEPLTIEEMLNKRTRIEMRTDDTEVASVTIDFSDKNNEYTFQRKQWFKKNSEGIIVLAGEPEVYIIDKTQNKPINDPQYFENFIPEELSGFFFFDGERIDRLAKIDGKKEIRKAILDILGLTNLEHINENLDSIKKDFNTEMKKSAKDKGLKEMNEQYELTNSQLDAEKEIEKDENFKLDVARKIKLDCDKYLAEHNAEKIRLLNKDREKLERDQTSIDGENGQKRLEQKYILSFISKNFKIFLISKFFGQINDLLEDKRKKKELPSDIKETFVKDLIDSEVCICGNSIIKDTKEYKKLVALLQTAGREELDSSYIKISAFINSNSTRESVDDFYNEIYKYKDKMLKLDERLEEIKKELLSIRNDLKNSDDKMIDAREAQREKAEEEIVSATKKIGLAEGRISSYNEKLRTLTGKIKKVHGQDQEADMYAKCFETSDVLLQLNNEIQKHFISTTHEDMDKKLKDVFGVLARKQDREPLLTKDFELKIVNKVSQKPQLQSTGERQITSLAFIGALVSYAKEKPNMQLISDFAGGDYPIVMDSPFGMLDEFHKSNVAKGIPSLATQIVVIVSNGQWKGEVEKNIYNRIGKLYEMSGGIIDIPDSEFTVFSEVK